MTCRKWKHAERYTYRWSPAKGAKWVNLGTDRLEAIATVAKLMQVPNEEGTLKQLAELYFESLEWSELRQSTKDDYLKAYKWLLKVFGAMLARDIRADHVYKYMRVYREGIKRANTERALLINILQHGVHLGELSQNEAAKVDRVKEYPSRYKPEFDDIKAFVDWLRSAGGTRTKLAVMAEFIAYCGNRRAEFIGLTLPQIGNDYIRLSRAKQRGGNEQIERIKVEGRVLELASAMRALERPEDSLHVFTNQKGQPITEGGFNSLWHRSMTEACANGIVSKRFTFHQLRAWHVTEFKRITGKLPELHKNPAVTSRIYDRTKEVTRGGL